MKKCILALLTLSIHMVWAQEAPADSTQPIPISETAISQSWLKYGPVRGVSDLTALTPGAIVHQGSLHMRGGRTGELQFNVDGLNVSPASQTEALDFMVIHNAIESLGVYGGGLNAGQSGYLSGLADVRLKTGGERLKLTGEIISDDFWKVKGDDGALRVLGLEDTYSYGYNDYILTLGGPVPGIKGLRFFTAGQAWNRASRTTRFPGFEQDALQLVQTWYKSDGSSVTDTLNYAVNAPAGRLPGYWARGWLTNSNLSWQRDGMAARAGFNYAYRRNRSTSAAPTLLTTEPLRPYNNTWRIWSGTLHFDHELSERMRYTLSGGYFSRFYEGADARWRDDLEKWGDPDLNPALLEASITRSFDLPYDDAWTIPYPGTPASTYSKILETRWQLQLDSEFKLSDSHLLRLGGRYERETLRRYSLAARRLFKRLQDVSRNPELYTDYDIYAGLRLTAIGYDYKGKAIDEDQHVATLQGGLTVPVSINLRNAPITPNRLAFYIEDEIMVDRAMVTAGLRYEQFSNGWWSLNDWTLLMQTTGGVLSEDDIDDEVTTALLLPRLSVNLPAGRWGLFHARWGKYAQAPDPDEVWGKSGYTTFMSQVFRSSYFAPMANPNLVPYRSTQWEGGFQMETGQDVLLDVTGFFKDNQKLLRYDNIIPQSGATYAPPTITINGDDGDVWGLTARLVAGRRAHTTLDVSYTMMRVLSLGSAADSHYDIAWQENAAVFPDNPSPTDFDVHHSLQARLLARVPQAGGFELAGAHPLENVTFSALFKAQSGFPYTEIGVDDALSQVYTYNAPKPAGPPNGARMGWNWQVDVTLAKAFRVGPVSLEAYIWAINLFDTKSVINVFRQTGSNTTDGWLNTEEGQNKVEDRGEEWVKWYQADLTNCGTFGWQPPRQLRAGLRFEI